MRAPAPCDVLWPGGAGLPAALERLGVAPGEITDVVLTHLDFDHAGGAVAGTWPEPLAPAFPSAPVHVAAFDLDWWWSAEERPLRVGPRILRDAARRRPARDVRRRRRGAARRARALGARPLRRATACSRSRAATACCCTSPTRSTTAATSSTPSGTASTTASAEIALATRTALLAEAEERGADADRLAHRRARADRAPRRARPRGSTSADRQPRASIRRSWMPGIPISVTLPASRLDARTAACPPRAPRHRHERDRRTSRRCRGRRRPSGRRSGCCAALAPTPTPRAVPPPRDGDRRDRARQPCR